LQINNWFDLALNTVFLFGVILIGLPTSGYLLIKGIEGFIKYGFKKLPENFLIASGFGSYSAEIILYGIFILSASIWILFFGKGGQLVIYVDQVKVFMGL